MIFWAVFENLAPQTENEILDNLLAGTARGDNEAFEKLYLHTKASVYGFALSILKNAHDAEDVLQNTFVTIYSASQSYVSQGKPLAWILTISKNLCLTRLRQDKNTTQIPDILPASLINDREAEQSENKVFLEKCLSILSLEEREILMLHAVSGLRHREISQLLSMPLATVLSKYHRAIKKIKKLCSKGDGVL